MDNALRDRPDDLPHLLRRIATAIEEVGIQPMDLLDVVIRSKIEAFGPWWSVQVYWKPEED